MTSGLAGFLLGGCQMWLPLRLDLRQTLGRIAELRQVDTKLVEQRQVEAAHLPVRFVQVVEDTTPLELAARATQ